MLRVNHVHGLTDLPKSKGGIPSPLAPWVRRPWVAIEKAIEHCINPCLIDPPLVITKGSFTNYVCTLTRFWLFLTTYPPALTFSMVWMLTKSGHFRTTYLPFLVNVICERPLDYETRQHKILFDWIMIVNRWKKFHACLSKSQIFYGSADRPLLIWAHLWIYMT